MESPLKRKDIPPQRREQILAAAAELFSRSGYHGVTVDAIAQRAGISKGNLYWYFKSKQEIFRLLIDYAAGRLYSPVIEAMLSDVEPRERLRAIAMSCIHAAEADPEALHLIWQIATQPELKDFVSPEFSTWVNPFIDYLKPLFTELGDKDPEGTAMLYCFTLDALMLLVSVDPGVYDMEKLMSAIENKYLSLGRE
jgi:AcrR family transcriptional regulator